MGEKESAASFEAADSLLSVDLDVDGLFEVVIDVFLYDFLYGFLEYRRCSEELSSWYVYGCSRFFECEELPELCFFGEFDSSFVVASFAVFFSSEGSCCLVVFVPEEFFHSRCDPDVSSFVVYGCVWQVREEGDGAVCCLAFDASPQLSCVGEDGSSLVSAGRLSSLPFFGEERLPLEVLVELVGEFYLDVA